LDILDFHTPKQMKGGRYITPAMADKMAYDSGTARRIYENQPIEKRAFKGGRTGRKATENLFSALDDPDYLPVDPPPKYYPPKPPSATPETPAALTLAERRKQDFDRLMELGGPVGDGKRLDSSDQRYRDIMLGGGAAAAAGLSGLGAAEEGEDDKATVGSLTKLRRKIAMAANPAWNLRESKKVAAKALPGEMFATRAQNSSFMDLNPKNRRGGAYVYASQVLPGERDINNLRGDSYFNIYLKPGVTGSKPPQEGGMKELKGFIKPKNPLTLNTDTFFGSDVNNIVPRGPKSGKYRDPVVSDIAYEAQKDSKAINAHLPRTLKLNNVDIRQIGSRDERLGKSPRLGISRDAVGDFLLNKYAKKYGYDSIVPREVTIPGGDTWRSREFLLPAESRWDNKPQFTASMHAILKELGVDPKRTWKNSKK
jgi:hypothetical protein